MESNSKSILAKLLARENITIQHGNIPTAYFDVENRVLGLPLFKEMDKNVYDLLIGHEVGHALETPSDGWHNSSFDIPGCPRAFINVVEDIRIEKLIQNRYPGLINSFKKGYHNLMVQDFFGIGDTDVNTMSFMNRLNLKSKLRDLISVDFSNEEQPYVDMAMAVQTWDDVIATCRAIYEYLKEKQKNEQKETQSSPNGGSGESSSEDSADESSDQSTSKETPSEQTTEPNSKDDTDSSYSLDSFENNNNTFENNTFQNEQTDQKTEETTKTLGSDCDDDINQDIMDTSTDDNFRTNENNLVERNRDGSIPDAINLCNSKQLQDMIIPYHEIARSRAENNQTVFSQDTVPDTFRHTNYKSELKTFVDETTKIVNVMVKEFEMRKAAFQYSRSKTSRAGSLNVNKLHEYKFNDDIFNKVTKLADAKSHGMVMFIDRSGSMRNILGNVIRQTLTLAMFCKKVGIPFDVYTFTSYDRHRSNTQEGYKYKVGDLYHSYTAVCHLLSSSFKKSDYTEAFNNLFYQTVGYDLTHYLWYSEYERMGGTPLVEVLAAVPELIAKFKNKHGVQKVIMPLLTDGAASSFSYVFGFNGSGYPQTTHSHHSEVVLNIGSNKYIRSRGNKLTSKLLDHIRGLGVTTVGYFLAQSNREFSTMVAHAAGTWDRDVFKQASKKVRAQNFVSYDNTLGYNRFFIMKAENKTLSTDIDDLEIRTGARSGEITRAFKKYASAKKTNRIFASQFAEIVS